MRMWQPPYRSEANSKHATNSQLSNRLASDIFFAIYNINSIREKDFVEMEK